MAPSSGAASSGYFMGPRKYLGLSLDLDIDEFKRLLMNLNRAPRLPPRKCRRLGKKNEIIASVSNETKPRRINFVFNSRIGNKGMEYLHLIPDSVVELDLSTCGLTPKGIIMLCKFLTRNKNITRMIVWGNEINDEAAEAIGQMIALNDTLRELCISFENSAATKRHLTDEAVKSVCRGLSLNRTLRSFDFRRNHVDWVWHDDFMWLMYFSSYFPVNSSLHSIDLVIDAGYWEDKDTLSHYGLSTASYYDLIYDKWERIVARNRQLLQLPCPATPKARYYLQLNKESARDAVEAKSSEVWLSSLELANRHDSLDALYFLIRKKPSMCRKK